MDAVWSFVVLFYVLSITTFFMPWTTRQKKNGWASLAFMSLALGIYLGVVGFRNTQYWFALVPDLALSLLYALFLKPSAEERAEMTRARLAKEARKRNPIDL